MMISQLGGKSERVDCRLVSVKQGEPSILCAIQLETALMFLTSSSAATAIHGAYVDACVLATRKKVIPSSKESVSMHTNDFLCFFMAINA